MPQKLTAAPHVQRIEAIDALRGLALLGVLVVNLVTEFRVSIFQQFLGTPPMTAFDRVAAGLLSLVVEGKAICLFSLLFGLGLAMQFDRLSRTERPYYRLGRRLLVLLGFGLIHLVFVWNGDILTEYAVMGLVVLPFIGMPARVLGIAAAGLLALHAAMPLLAAPIPLPGHVELQAHVDAANSIYPSGSLVDIWRFSVAELRLLLPLHLLILPRTLGLFFLGAYLWRSGLLQAMEKRSSGAKAAAAILGIGGLALTFGTSSRDVVYFGSLAPALAQLAPIILALGYATSVVALSQSDIGSRLLSVFAPAGRMAFSNYLLQSVIFCLLFFGYGLGLYGRSGVASTLALGIGVYVMQLIWSRRWLRRFRFGPLEWCWRSMTYGALQPFGRLVVPANQQSALAEQV